MEEVIINFEDGTIVRNVQENVQQNVQQKLSNLFNKYKQLSHEDKEKFQKGAIDALAKALRKVPEKIPQKMIFPTWLVLCKSYIPFIFATSCVTLLLVMGVCRVYRRIWERKQRHIEKKRLKQQKAEAKLQNAKKKKQ